MTPRRDARLFVRDLSSLQFDERTGHLLALSDESRLLLEQQRFAFEVQLSTTFLTEIVGRREFYRVNGGAIVWVFEGFNPQENRTAEQDIFYLNNLNVFVVNERTLERSR